MLTTTQVGLRIKAARQERGISQAQLGQMLERKRSHAAISDIERGKTNLGVGELDELARLLGTTLTALIEPVTPFIEANPATITFRRSSAAATPQERAESEGAVEAFKEYARARAQQRAKG